MSDDISDLADVTEGVSELSANDDIEVDQLENGCEEHEEGEDEFLYDEAYAPRNDSRGANNSLDENAPTQSSTISNSEVTKAFHKVPSLNRVFKKIPSPDGKPRATCLSCNITMNTAAIPRFVLHTKKCPGLSKEIRGDVIEDYEKSLVGKTDSREMIDFYLTRMIAESNCDFKLLDRRPFRKFLELYRSNPHYSLPDRHHLSQVSLPRLSARIDRRFKRRAKNATLSAEFDCWTDKKRMSILAIVLTSPDGSRYLHGIKDVSVDSKSAHSMKGYLEEMLAGVSPNCINSIVSDSASACKKAREMIVETPNYKHVIQHRCVPHLLNRIGHRFTKSALVDKAVEWAIKLTGLINNNPDLLKAFQTQHINRISRGTDVRWYSHVNMIEGLIAAKDLLIVEAPKQTQTMKALILDRNHWSTIEGAVKILRPLANCIGQAEGCDCSLGAAMKHILEFGKMLFHSNLNDAIVREAIASFVAYFSYDKLGDELGLMIAAYMLDRRNDMMYLSEKAIDLALCAVISVAKKIGAKNEEHKAITVEFSNFAMRRGVYGQAIEDGQTAIDWWSARRESGKIATIALKLTHLRSSSANIERVFSTMKYIQGTWRLNMDLDTILHLTRCRVAKIESPTEVLMKSDDRLLIDEEYIDSDFENDDMSSSSVRVYGRSSTISNRVANSESMPSEGSITSYFSNLKVREHVSDFLELIDYSTITRPAARTTHSCEEEDAVDIDELLRTSRELRRSS